jgi:hypothetical protein
MKSIVNDTTEIAISRFALEVTEGRKGTRIAGMIRSNYSMDVYKLDDSAKKKVQALGRMKMDIYISDVGPFLMQRLRLIKQYKGRA